MSQWLSVHALVLSGSCSVEQVNEAATAHGSVVWGVFCRVIVCDSVGIYS